MAALRHAEDLDDDPGDRATPLSGTQLQPRLAAIALQGPKGVGKTATATRRASTVLPLQYAEVRERFAADPAILTTVNAPILVDEWQR